MDAVSLSQVSQAGEVDLAAAVKFIRTGGFLIVDGHFRCRPAHISVPINIVGTGIIEQADPTQPVLTFSSNLKMEGITLQGHADRPANQQAWRLLKAEGDEDTVCVLENCRVLQAPAHALDFQNVGQVFLRRVTWRETYGLSTLFTGCGSVRLESPRFFKIGFPGGNAVGAAGAGALAEECGSVVIDDALVEDCSDSPIYLIARTVEVRNSRIFRCAKSNKAQSFGPSPDFAVERVLIENNIIEYAGLNCLSAHSPGGPVKDVAFRGNRLIAPRAKPIHLHPDFPPNDHSTADVAGIYADNIERFTAEDNFIDLTDADYPAKDVYGIWARGPFQQCRIAGNRIQGAGTRAILVKGNQAYTAIEGNRVAGTIETLGNADPVFVHRNSADAIIHQDTNPNHIYYARDNA